MHFSRMRTVRSSSRLLGRGAPLPGDLLPAPGCVCVFRGRGGGVGLLPAGGIPACTEADPPVDRQTGVKTKPSDGNKKNVPAKECNKV